MHTHTHTLSLPLLHYIRIWWFANSSLFSVDLFCSCQSLFRSVMNPSFHDHPWEIISSYQRTIHFILSIANEKSTATILGARTHSSVRVCAVWAKKDNFSLVLDFLFQLAEYGAWTHSSVCWMGKKDILFPWYWIVFISQPNMGLEPIRVCVLNDQKRIFFHWYWICFS